MTYEGLLNLFKVDVNDPLSPALQWFVDNDSIETKNQKITTAGLNTYARVSPLLPGGFVQQYADPVAGLNNNNLIYTWLYTPPRGVKRLHPAEQQIFQLWGALQTQAVLVTEAGYGAQLHSFRTIPEASEFPDYHPESGGLIARVTHRIIWTMKA